MIQKACLAILAGFFIPMKFLLFLLSAYFLQISLVQANTQQQGILTENIRGIPLQFLDHGEALSPDNAQRLASIQKITDTAKQLSGTPYRSGGTRPETGFDCSGFVRYVFNEVANIRLPNNVRQIAKVGIEVKKEALQPGDLLFFNTLKLPFTHVGIYVGDQQFIHAPSPGGVVRLDHLESTYWAKHFNGAKRIAID